MAYDEAKVLKLVKYRLNRMPTDTARDDYYKSLIKATDEEMQEYGVKLSATSETDAVLLADYVAWHHNNRDEHMTAVGVTGRGEVPRWLQGRLVGRSFHNKDDAE